MQATDPTNFFFEMGPIRPPSEGRDYSLLLRTTRNCAWNRCEFCPTYRGQKFGYRKVAGIKRDIDVAKTLHDEIKEFAARGPGGRITQDVLRAIWEANPQIYREAAGNLALKWQNLVNLANWINSGAVTVFLQDADAFIMLTPHLVETLAYLKETFPTIARVTAYGRSKSVARKSPEELAQIRQAGLVRLHVGLESGCDEVLARMKKGVTAREQVDAGRKAVAAGISLSEYVMPGLGGKELSERHARDSAAVLNEINPDFIRLRSLVLRRHSPLAAQSRNGQFTELGEDEIVEEIGLLIENLHCRSYLASDQMANLLYEVEGRLPEDKEAMLRTIGDYRRKSPEERLAFRLSRRVQSFLAVYGILEPELHQKVEEAREALRLGRPEAGMKTEAAVSALKEGFV